MLNLERYDLYGVEWAWLSFGSEGRDEQTMSTDQDNGIVYVCTDIMDREQTQLRLLEFARDVNLDLDKCGFPLCSGNIMASNPELCLTLEEWEEKFERWIRTPEPQALLNATIFFDFRPLHGAFNLADRLRLTLLRRTRDNPLFLRLLAANALSVAPPLGTFRDFVTDADEQHPGTIDLKKYGARLFIDAARVFALANDVAATNTVQRLKQSALSMAISADEAAAVVDGFNFIQLMRLRHQHAEQVQGREGGNLIRPDELNEVERRILKESFRQARKLQAASQARLPALSMRWFSRLFGSAANAVCLPAEQCAALADWQRLPAVDLNAAHERCRYVVVDVETSGLNMRRDRLISIGAVALVDGRIDFADAFAVILRQERVSPRENILIHGIGASAQSEGVDPAGALLAFLGYIGKAPTRRLPCVF